jgi:hypothetical protein
MADATIEDFSIPLTVNIGNNVIWGDEWDWTPIPQKVRQTIDGGAVVETLGPASTLQTITLKCNWLSKAKVDQLVQLRDRTTQSVMTLTLCDGRTKDILFSHEKGPPVQVVPVMERPDYTAAPNPDEYDVILNCFDATGL